MIEPMRLMHRYRDAHSLDVAWVASLIESLGLPLELVHICADRVLHITALDYEESHPRPLTQQEWWWWEAVQAPLPPPYTTRGAMYAVDRHGTWHVVTRQDGTEDGRGNGR